MVHSRTKQRKQGQRDDGLHHTARSSHTSVFIVMEHNEQASLKAGNRIQLIYCLPAACLTACSRVRGVEGGWSEGTGPAPLLSASS